MKTLLIVVAVLFTATSLSALGTGNRVMPPSDESYTANFRTRPRRKRTKRKRLYGEKRHGAGTVSPLKKVSWDQKGKV